MQRLSRRTLKQKPHLRLPTLLPLIPFLGWPTTHTHHQKPTPPQPRRHVKTSSSSSLLHRWIKRTFFTSCRIPGGSSSQGTDDHTKYETLKKELHELKDKLYPFAVDKEFVGSLQDVDTMVGTPTEKVKAAVELFSTMTIMECAAVATILSKKMGMPLPMQGMQMPMQGMQMPMQGMQMPMQGMQMPMQGMQMPMQGMQMPMQQGAPPQQGQQGSPPQQVEQGAPQQETSPQKEGGPQHKEQKGAQKGEQKGPQKGEQKGEKGAPQKDKHPEQDASKKPVHPGAQNRPKKALFTVTLKKFPEGAKFKVLKEVRVLRPGMNLIESKELVDQLPSTLQKGIPENELEEWKTKLEAVGAEIDIVPEAP